MGYDSTVKQESPNGLLWVVAAVALAATTFSFGGCEARVPSPKNPAITVPASVAINEAEQLAKAKEFESRAALNRFRVEAKRIEAEHEISLADLQANLDEYVEKTQGEAQSLRETTAAAVKAAEDRQNAWVGGITQVASIAESTGIPGVATIGSLLVGVAGLFSANRNKQRAKTAEEIAQAEADKRANQERIAARIIDAMDILKLKSPEVAAAFKANSKELAEWIGPEGTALVNRVQHS